MTINVSCAIIQQRIGEIVYTWAARKGADSHLHGLWEFPGGKVEAGEHAHDAIVREIEEELGILISVKEELLAHTHDYGSHRIRLIPFICRTESLPLAMEHDALACMTTEGLLRLSWAPADIPILREYTTYMRSHL